jgi:hypothetical protein
MTLARAAASTPLRLKSLLPEALPLLHAAPCIIATVTVRASNVACCQGSCHSGRVHPTLDQEDATPACWAHNAGLGLGACLGVPRTRCCCCRRNWADPVVQGLFRRAFELAPANR